jgi:hypothetical protein
MKVCGHPGYCSRCWHIFIIAAVCVMAQDSVRAQGQISVQLTSVQLSGSGQDTTEYCFLVSGNVASSSGYMPYGVIFNMSGFDSSMPVGGAFSGGSSGLPGAPDDFENNQITVAEYFSGDSFDNTFNVTSFGPVVQSLSWDFTELGIDSPYESVIFNDAGTVVVPEPGTLTGFIFGAVGLWGLSVSKSWRRRVG